MSNNLSANFLFHFTKRKANLDSILKNRFFYPQYSKENIFGKTPKGDIIWHYIPMVCFCDIPLGMVTNHCNNYGKYGIGLSLEWAKRMRLNPVFYIADGSEVFEGLLKTNQYSKYDKQSLNTPIDMSLLRSIMLIHHYVKPYSGRSNKKDEEVRFYDEKEWRHIPKFYGDKVFIASANKITSSGIRGRNERLRDKCDKIKKFMDRAIIDLANAVQEDKKNRIASAINAISQKDHALHFEYKDIEYIILKTEKEKEKLIKNIKCLFNLNIYEQEKEFYRLVSNITSIEKESAN